MLGGAGARGGRTRGRPVRMPAPAATPKRGSSPTAMPPGTPSTSGSAGTNGGSGGGSDPGRNASGASSGNGSGAAGRAAGGATSAMAASGGADAAPNTPPRRRRGRGASSPSPSPSPSAAVAARAAAAGGSDAAAGRPAADVPARAAKPSLNCAATRSCRPNRSSSTPSTRTMRRAAPVSTLTMRAVIRISGPSRSKPPVTSQATPCARASVSPDGGPPEAAPGPRNGWLDTSRLTTVSGESCSRSMATVSAMPAPSHASAASPERLANGVTATVPGRGGRIPNQGAEPSCPVGWPSAGRATPATRSASTTRSHGRTLSFTHAARAAIKPVPAAPPRRRSSRCRIRQRPTRRQAGPRCAARRPGCRRSPAR